jgi:hypothetical protein
MDFVAMSLVAWGLGIVYAYTLAPDVTWANNGADSGDFVTAAATLGIAHPTGYPTYVLLARLFQFIPIGSLAFRVNLLSAVAAILTTLCVYALVRRLLPDEPTASSQTTFSDWRVVVAAAAAALSLGSSPTFWSQSVIAEVYTVSALFGTLLLLWTLSRFQNSTPTMGWPDRLRAICAGLALGTHVTIALLILVWAALGDGHLAMRTRLQLIGQRLVWICVGALVYLYLPIRAAAHPPLNWGDAQNWAGFWWVISGQPYRDLAFGLPHEFLGARIAAWIGLLAHQFGWLGLVLGCFGLLYGRARPVQFLWLTMGITAVYSIFAITYNTADSYAYLIPTYIIFTIWIGLGIATLLRFVTQWWPWAAPFVAILAVVGLLWTAPMSMRQADASQDRRASAFATSTLALAPPHAIVLTSSDRDTFALWYGHHALGLRPDITIVATPLLRFPWYRVQLRRLYPALRLPEQPDSGWDTAIAAANRGQLPFCRTVLDGAQPLICEPVP